MLVKAKPGEKCPCEGAPRTYITDNPKGTPVDDTSYYRRLLNDGSLTEVRGTEKQDRGTERQDRGTRNEEKP